MSKTNIPLWRRRGLWSKEATLFSLLFIIGALAALFLYRSGVVFAEECGDDCEPVHGSLYGYKWYDYDGDGQWDRDEELREPPLERWTIYLIDDDGEVVVTTETNSDGYYAFEEVAEGTYTVCERSYEHGWSETFPNAETEETVSCEDEDQSPFGYRVSVKGGRYGEFNFGNTFALSAIRALKFSDLNNDGSRDRSEPLLPGWKICSAPDDIGDEDGFLSNLWDFFFRDWEDDAGNVQSCLDTDKDGAAIWPHMPPGEYEIWEEMTEEQRQEGWRQTSPDNDDIELGFGKYGNREIWFGNHLPTITAFKYWDKNGSGERDEYWTAEWQFDEDEEQWIKVYKEEPALEGWNMCLERFANDAWVLVSCKPTNTEGLASWIMREEGEYRLSEEPKEGWVETQPEPGENGSIRYYTFEFEPWDERETRIYSFGNTQNIIRAIKFWDRNHSGERDGDSSSEEWDPVVKEWVRRNILEPGLAEWEICLYRKDGEEDKPTRISCKKTNGEGWVEWTGLAGGNYFLREVLPEGEEWFPTNGGGEEGDEWSVELAQGEVIVGIGNDITILTVEKFFDRNQNGRRDDPADEPVIPNWNMCLSRQDERGPTPVGCRPTDKNGVATWRGLNYGEYEVREEAREERGWKNTSENNPESFGLSQGDERVVRFGNWIDDRTPPVSSFDNSFKHHVIDTEIVALELSGTSIDPPLPLPLGEEAGPLVGFSGVRNATLTIRALGGPEEVANFPAKSFFDVFTKLDCKENGPIPIEIVSLTLVSIDPITTSGWNQRFSFPRAGIYCFEVRAIDHANNSEETAYAGPVAYIPTPKISKESTSEVDTDSFVVQWTTPHPATSRVIYDTVQHEELGEAPNYGYAFSTEEGDLDPHKVTEHSVTVSGLAAGTTYYYRSVSVGSPTSVGPQGSVTTSSPPPPPSPPPSSSGGNIGSGGGGGGGGLPPGAYDPPTPPAGGFKIFINDGAPQTNSREVILSLNGGPNTAKMTISNFPDFRGPGQEPYQTTKTWTLTQGTGVKTVYGLFFTQYGYSSKLVTDEIVYQEVIAAPREIPTEVPTVVSTLTQNISTQENIVPPASGTPQNEEIKTQSATEQNKKTGTALSSPTAESQNPPSPPAGGLFAAIFNVFTFGTNLAWLGWLSVIVLTGATTGGIYYYLITQRSSNK